MSYRRPALHALRGVLSEKHVLRRQLQLPQAAGLLGINAAGRHSAAMMKMAGAGAMRSYASNTESKVKQGGGKETEGVEDSLEEKASPTAKEKKEEISQQSSSTPAKKQEEIKKLTLWEKVKHEANHYWSGTKLLGFEIKVTTKLLIKMLRGYELTRREHTQLKRTINDVLRLVPFSAFVLVPFAELLLPFALKLFPNLLPSTYESNVDKEKKRAKFMSVRSKTSTFLRNTIQESNNLMKLPVKISEAERFEFIEFFRKINIIDQRPSNEQIIKVARLFKDDDVLDNLSRPQLVAMAKYMGLTPFGTDSFIRYQIRTKLIAVVQDDRVIRYEGVESLSVTELKLACRSRGLKNIDVSPGRLRDDLSTWLDLRLKQKIPATLLIMSSIYTYGQSDVNNYYDALLNVLSSIPDEVYDVAKADLSDDYKMKLSVLKEQEEKIREENEQEKQMHKHQEQPVKDDKNVDEVSEPAAKEEGEIEEETKKDDRSVSKEASKNTETDDSKVIKEESKDIAEKSGEKEKGESTDEMAQKDDQSIEDAKKGDEIVGSTEEGGLADKDGLADKQR